MDAAGLAHLRADPRVAAVYADGTLHATLVEGRALIRADVVAAAGVDGTGVTVPVADTGIDYRTAISAAASAPAAG